MSIQDHYIPKTDSKEFAFTKLIKCGYCESGITADEKFKLLKDGGTGRYVYYMCTRGKGVECKNPAINEKDLIEELISLLDKIDLDELGMKEKIREEISRYNRFRIGVLGIKTKNEGVQCGHRRHKLCTISLARRHADGEARVVGVPQEPTNFEGQKNLAGIAT